MQNPVPTRFRRPLGHVGFFALVYLAATGLHALVGGRTGPPSWLVVGVFLAAALVATYLRAAMRQGD